MLERPVRINNSTYARHEITGIDHDFLQNRTVVRITSYNENESYNTWISQDLNVGVTPDELYGWLAEQPQFEAYVNDDTDRLGQVMAVLTDEQLENFPTEFFPGWKSGTYYLVGTRVGYSGGLFRCISAHTSQDDWTPVDTPALWATVRASEVDPNIIEEWVQPDSTNPYMTGDKVLHNGSTWESAVDNNVWEPGAVGTEALWTLLDIDDSETGETGDTGGADDETGYDITGDDQGSDEGDIYTGEPVDNGDQGDGTDEGQVEYTDPEPVGYPEWTQPDSTNAYQVGDRVTHNGNVWESAAANNVWEPGIYGWNVVTQ